MQNIFIPVTDKLSDCGGVPRMNICVLSLWQHMLNIYNVKLIRTC